MKLRRAAGLLRQDRGFPGGNAGASLKLLVVQGIGVDFQHGFPGGNAGASLKQAGSKHVHASERAVSPAGMPGPH